MLATALRLPRVPRARLTEYSLPEFRSIKRAAMDVLALGRYNLDRPHLAIMELVQGGHMLEGMDPVEVRSRGKKEERDKVY